MHRLSDIDGALKRLACAAVAAFLLLSMLTAQALAGEHRHDLVGAEQRECAACLVAQAAAVEPPLAPAVAPPLPRGIALAKDRVRVVLALPFSHAVPLACGPPA